MSQSDRSPVTIACCVQIDLVTLLAQTLAIEELFSYKRIDS